MLTLRNIGKEIKKIAECSTLALGKASNLFLKKKSTLRNTRKEIKKKKSLTSACDLALHNKWLCRMSDQSYSAKMDFFRKKICKDFF